MLKYFNGENMANMCKRRGIISEQEAKKLITTIAKTLKYCHENNIAHCDIKAENILIGIEGRLKLIDFAFACKLDGSNKKVETYCGTPSYMSPEIFSQQPHCPKKADVWALGVLAFKLIVGELPYTGRILYNDQRKETSSKR